MGSIWDKIIKIVIGFTLVVIIVMLARSIIDAIVIQGELKNAKKAITIRDNVHMYSSARVRNKFDNIEIGRDVYILNECTDKNNNDWYKVKVGKKVGYILSEDIGMYKKWYDDKSLMLDVSKFNMEKNFKNIGEFKAFVINNNIKFVYIRAGGRGYGKAGKMYTDSCADEYAEACEFLGVPFGYYFLDEAINQIEIDEEAEFIKEYIQNHKYKKNTLPIALDVEKHSEPGRADKIWNTRADLVNSLIKKVEDSGNKVILYSNAKLAGEYLNDVSTEMWIAYYPEIKEVPDFDYLTNMEKCITSEDVLSKMIGWQFSENGLKNIINDKVDLSIVYSKYMLGKKIGDTYEED